MSGFDLTELLPFYLDETDEQIAGLNDALLKLEADPSDAPVLREAFRLIHSIKGSSTVMGFDQVKNLTHHLETFFDRLRSGSRTLDRATLDLSFRCLDGLRDYHRELRSGGSSSVELSGLTAEVIASLQGEAPPASQASDAGETPSTSEPSLEVARPEAQSPDSADPSGGDAVVVTVSLDPHLPWPDMKAKLVLNRLTANAQVLATDPPVETLESVHPLLTFRVWLAPGCEADELRALADVDGVTRVVLSAGSPPVGFGTELPPETSSAPPPAAAPVVPVAEVVAPAPAPAPSPIPALEQTPPAPSSPPEPLPSPAPPDRTSPWPAPAPAGGGGPSGGTPAKKVTETLRVEVDRLDFLMNLAGELVINRARFHEVAQGLEELFLDSNARLLTADTQDRLDALGHELEGFSAAQGSRGDASFERWVSQFRRLRDNFDEIRRELDLIRLGRERVTALSEAIHQLGRVTDGLQKGVLETRMVPIGPLFDRFHRVIRDLRVPSGKEVVLKIEGEKTELDKRMIDELGDPLIHLVRNSVDHGLEPPEAREAAGKPRSGTVRLQASHRGNSVVITVSDDGRGIDCERVRRKVVEKGLVPEDEARRLTDRQLVTYIWHPGLSTAEAVTDISGRGVGMDIVKARIENLNGAVDVRTEPGQGTTFTIRLPLTLAILPCLLARVFDEVYAIPTDHVDEIVEVADSAVFRVRDRRMFEVRGRLVALVGLDDVMSWGRPRPAPPPAEPRAGEGNGGKVVAVVVQNGETTAGLVVDQLIGMHEVVLKSLEKNFRPVPGLSGASILGDGRVSLILDVDAVLGKVGHDPAPQPA